MQNLFIYLGNACIALLYYFQMYFWYIIMFILMMGMGAVEYHEKQHLYVDDERKVV